MRWAVLTVACASCASVAHDKMPWPQPAGPAGTTAGMGGAVVEAGGGSTGAAADDATLHDAAAAGEIDVVSEPPAPPTEASDVRIELQWPVATTGINSLFGERIDPLDGKRRFHGGVDLEAPYGTLVVAAAPGLVVHSGWAHGHGRQVVVEHAGGFRTVYSHLAQILVTAGTHVRAGDAVGQVGNSGRSTGAHLHFEVSRWGRPLDPIDILDNPITVR